MQPSWKAVMEVTKTAMAQNDFPLVWGTDLVTCIHKHGIGLPSVELSSVLVHCLVTNASYASSTATIWTYIQHAMSCQMVSVLHMLALLTSRILPSRHQQPENYRMYLELTSTFVFSLSSTKLMLCRDRVVKAVDEALQLSNSPDTPITEVGIVIVHFLFALMARLAESVYEDWKSNEGSIHGRTMESGTAGHEEKHEMGLEQLKKTNSLAAVHLMAKIIQNKRTADLLRIARRNLQDQWTLFVQRLQLLESLTNDPSSKAPKEAMDALGQLANAIQQGLHQEWRSSQMPVIHALLPSSCRSSSFGNAGGLGYSSPWLPFDIYMEAAMEGRRLSQRSNAEILADVMKAMQSVHAANWVDLFLGLWTAGLRLVKRDRESMEGPNTHVESRLCMLLSILPLAAGIVIEEEERGQPHPENISGDDKDRKIPGGRRAALETCLQVLGQFESLLVPPTAAVTAANQVAAKVAAFVSTGGQKMNVEISNSVGTMRHLIVDSCVSRGLLDNSAYFWLVTGGQLANIPSSPSQPSPWSVFMDGAPFSGSLRVALMSCPAGSVAELEKVYKTAIVGPEEERAAAASILCGASLIRSWNVQEYAVHFAVQLLSPPVAENWGGNSNPLIGHAPMLYAALQGMNTADAMNVLSLFGMFPELAASLLPICEVFGSLSNSKPVATVAGEDVTAHMLFSVAFLQLVKLWKFHRPPLEHCLLGSGASLGADLSLEYLLQLRNMQLASPSDRFGKQRMQVLGSTYTPSSGSVVSLDSFPRLQIWYMQHQACISATVSGLLRNNPMHQVGDRLLAMMFKKVNKSSPGPTPGISGSPSEDVSGRPILCAWDIIAAVPNVLEYSLTACAHGSLSPRDLTTGLRELVDYLPGAIATIVSYCSAETTRGLWKYASMNGQDWPSPAANLLTIQGEVKDILAAVGVHIPNPTGSGGGNAPVSLPLPLAALIGLTITFKLDRAGDTLLSVAGPGLESCSGAGPWFSMQVVAALWAQKVRRWHDYIVFISSCSVFKHNKPAMLQLLKSCFAVTLSSSPSLGSKLQMNGGVGALLGSWSAYGPEPVAPGIVYLRSYVFFHDIMFLSDEILILVAEAARELGTQGDFNKESLVGLGSRLRCVQASLPNSMARAVQASSLGASLLYVSGGAILVAKLFTDSIPTWFLSGKGSKGIHSTGGLILEGYAIAHFVLLSGALAWGVSGSSAVHLQAENTGIPSQIQRHYVLGAHMDFLASGLGGEIFISCEQTLWRSYVVGFLALMVTCTPMWILELKLDTLQKLATGNNGSKWNEYVGSRRT
uniref:Mediator of RNA polymerase II transcription subunit 33A n=1 Tax=Physcomitrium patens TaxID=3218 RepID=A0A7I4DT41_PHYPA